MVLLKVNVTVVLSDLMLVNEEFIGKSDLILDVVSMSIEVLYGYTGVAIDRSRITVELTLGLLECLVPDVLWCTIVV